MPKRTLSPLLLATIAGGALYPFVVYYGMQIVPPRFLVCLGLALLGLRLVVVRRRSDGRLWQAAFCVGAFGLLGLMFLSPDLAVKAYPVIMSLSVGAIFAISLVFPPTIIERFARMTEPNLPREGVVYCKWVTVAWIVFLLINAFISMATAVWGSLVFWTLWNGLISYVLMGSLFLGEVLLRRIIRRRIQ